MEKRPGTNYRRTRLKPRQIVNHNEGFDISATAVRPRAAFLRIGN